MSKTITLISSIFVFCFFVITGNLIAQDQPDAKAHFTFNPKPHVILQNNEAPLEEVFGLNQNVFGPSGSRGRGNIFYCNTARKLIEHRLYLNLTGVTNMYFLVYEGTAQTGLYNQVSSVNRSGQGPGEGWYSSGSIDYDFVEGMYYMIYAQWDVNANYYTENPVAIYPIPCSFGELQTGVGWDWVPTYAVPPPATQTCTAAFTVPVAYYQTIVTEDIGGGVLTIAQAREDLDNDFVPDRLGDTVTVQGTVVSVNYNTNNFNHVVWDGTAGIFTIGFGFGIPNYNIGDELEITGTIGQYSGLTQLEALDLASVTLLSSGNPDVTYEVLTLQQFYSDPEAYEASFIALPNMYKVAGQTWPSAGQNANVLVTDMVDTITMRIDKEADLDENPEPTWPIDILGFGGQYDNTTPPDGGYQIQPRLYSELLPGGTVPVELTSFTANAADGSVILNWVTATEQNNLGFEVQRRSGENYKTLGFINGHGNSTVAQNYSYTDNSVSSGTYYYRLKQIDYNGAYKYSEEVAVVVVMPSKFVLQQNYPNPFNPSTMITFSVPVDGNVSLTVYNSLGEEVTQLIKENLPAGTYNVEFAAGENLSSGIYFYQLRAGDFVQSKKMILMK